MRQSWGRFWLIGAAWGTTRVQGSDLDTFWSSCLHVLLAPFLFPRKQAVVEGEVGQREPGQLVSVHMTPSPPTQTPVSLPMSFYKRR